MVMFNDGVYKQYIFLDYRVFHVDGHNDNDDDNAISDQAEDACIH